MLDAEELVRGEAEFFIYKYVVLIIIFLIVVYLVDRDVSKNFTRVFKEFLTRTVKVAKALGTYVATDDLYLNPFLFYDDMLETMVQETELEHLSSDTSSKTD